MPDNSLQTINIENKILVIREQQVMLDRDLAELYGVETKVLNQAVKNINEKGYKHSAAGESLRPCFYCAGWCLGGKINLIF